MRSKKFLNIQNSNSSNILLSMSGFPGHKASFWGWWVPWSQNWSSKDLSMVKLKCKFSVMLSAHDLDREKGEEQGHGWGSPSGLVGTGSGQARRTPGKPELVMRSEQVWESWRQPWGEKEEQRERNVTTASMDHEIAKAALTCWDILWVPLIGDPLLWDWRQQDAGGEVRDGGQSSLPCGSASSGKWVGNADSWAPCALHRISESWQTAWETAVSSGPSGDSDVLRILLMELTLWVTLAQETTYSLWWDFPWFGIVGGKKPVQKCPVFSWKM